MDTQRGEGKMKQSQCPECYFLPIDFFSLDKPSRQLQSIKKSLAKGFTVQISIVECGLEESLVSQFFVLHFYGWYEQMVTFACEQFDGKVLALENRHITQLGIDAVVVEKLFASLHAGLIIFFIPDNREPKIGGNYAVLIDARKI